MKKKIFIIDDDEIILQLISVTLESEGYEVETFSSALGTTSKIIAAKPDLILVDVNMPGLSGSGLISVLHKLSNDSKLPIVFYSSIEESELKTLSIKHNVLGYIHKTTNVIDLISKINHFLSISDNSKK